MLMMLITIVLIWKVKNFRSGDRALAAVAGFG